MKQKRVLLLSCSVIVLCICILAGMSYALFSDSISVGNHLRAGNLKISLKRTGLEYSALNADGELDVTTITGSLNLTTSSENNVFGIDSSNIRIAPGSYFDADLEIANVGNTAFTYAVSVKLLGNDTALTDQLKVIVTDCDGNRQEAMLSELAGGLQIDTGKMKVGDGAQKFNVRVEFVDDVEYNRGRPADEHVNNNDAQSKTAAFDLIVTATQATTAD